MFIQTNKWYYNLDIMVKYELLDWWVEYKLTFINWEIYIITEWDDRTRDLFNKYCSSKSLAMRTE